MKLKEGFLLRQVAGQTVVLPTGGELDVNMMITLNDTGAFLWHRLAEETDESALIAALLAEYSILAPPSNAAEEDKKTMLPVFFRIILLLINCVSKREENKFT